jgi:hypothetical protein
LSLSTVRHLLLVRFITGLKADLFIDLSRENTTGYISIDSHAQDTTALHPSVFCWSMLYKVKGKGHYRTGHEGPEGEQMYNSTLPSTSALDGGWVVNVTPRQLYRLERPVTHCRGGWVGPRAGLVGCGKSRLHRGSHNGPSSP